MRSLNEILEGCVASGRSFAAQALAAESAETGSSPDSIRAGLAGRLKDMEFSVKEAASGGWRGLLVPEEAFLLEEYGKKGTSFSSPFVLTAARISISVATYNSAMGRIVAAPTAGSCGILPGMLFACREHLQTDDESLIDGLITAAAVGEVTEARATLAGASGGCQAECGAAAAMGSAALV
ncbi:MAG: L-serine ammonia-lyase, iron-sulfur-dependent, subunit alpha, partial [Aminobacteriaceae bacterium]